MSEFYRYIKGFEVKEVGQLQEIADLLEKTLKGKKYSWVEAYEYLGWRPALRTHQSLSNISIWLDDQHEKPEFGGVHVSDTYGVWGISTKDIHPDYITFFENGLEVELTTPAGMKAWWQVYVED